ncbi:MAG: TIGR04076 family protein [Gemmatimonadota bacterium]
MHELKVSVKKVMGRCTANPPVKQGDYFILNDGDISLPEGGFICAWALQSLIPVLTPKERDSAEDKDADWMWRVHHAQCPDPEGRVIYQIERTRVVDPDEEKGHRGKGEVVEPHPSAASSAVDGFDESETSEGGLVNLKIHVESVTGKCTSRMRPGTTFTLRSGRLYIPPGEHACLYALHAALPFFGAKQRTLEDGDWMKEDNRVLCPDPSGNVILRIERME